MLYKLLVLLVLLFSVSCTSQSTEFPNHLSFAVPYELDKLDPHGWDTLSSISIAAHFYEGLVTVDPNLNLRPGLAARWQNPDSFTWILYLRPNIRFHSGKELTSKDVVYSFQRVRNDPSLEMSVYVRNIAEIRAKDRLTVEIRTVRPSSVFLNKIRMISIVPEGSSSKDLEDAEDGTGPYRLLEWKKGDVVRMIRNEDYWGRKPFLQRADFILGQSPEEALESLRTGRCQFVQCNSKQLEDTVTSAGFQVLRSDSLFVKYIGFNLSSAQSLKNPFSNKLIRQAIHHGVNRKEMVSNLSFYAMPATQPIPISVFGYNPEIPPVAADCHTALSLFRSSGWNTREPLVMHVREIFKETGLIVQSELAACGIPLEIKIVADAQFFEMRKNGQVLSYISRYGCTTGDASDLMEDLFYSPDRAGLLDGLSSSKYSHPSIEGTAPDALPVLEHRRTGLQTIMSMLMEDLLLVPLYVDQDAYALEKSYTWHPRYDSLILASEVNRAGL